MKKVLGFIGLLFGFVAISHAGTPVENYYMGQPALSGVSIVVSSASTAGAANLRIVVANSSSTIGGGTTSCRNCFTKYIAQLSTTSILTVMDGGTTVQTIDGLALGSGGPATYTNSEDHLGPLCLAVGNTTTFLVSQTATGAANHHSINVEGYTNCGGTANAGPMQ